MIDEKKLKEFTDGYEWVNARENAGVVEVDDNGYLYVRDDVEVEGGIPDYVLTYIAITNEREKRAKLRHQMRVMAGVGVSDNDDEVEPRLKLDL